MTKMQSQNTTYKCIDIVKLIASVLVVFIHANECNEFLPSLIVQSLSGSAVPFFFIASGFFLIKGLDNQCNQRQKSDYTKKYITKLLITYLFWMGITLPETIISYNELYPNSSFINLTLIILRRCLLAGSGVYWYILILVESAIILYFIYKRNAFTLLKVLIVVGLILGVLYDCFNDILVNTPYSYINRAFYTIFSWSNNFIMKGIPYMGIGFLIHKHQITVNPRILYWVLSLLSIANIILYILFTNNIIHIKLWLIITIIQAIVLFLMAAKTNINIGQKASLYCRELSSVIYFVHCFSIYYITNPLFGIDFNFWLKSAIALITSTIVYMLVKIIPLPALKYVFNIK